MVKMHIYTIKEIKERFFFGDSFQSNLIVRILSHIPSLLHVPLHLTWIYSKFPSSHTFLAFYMFPCM
jgi:hypothetical protein